MRLLVALWACFTLFLLPARASVLHWGADAEGGAPYVFQDPKQTDRLIGFEMDLVTALGVEMKRSPQMVQMAWESLVPALMRGDIDLAINGLEITPERQASIDFSRPYYVFSQQIAARKNDFSIQRFEDLKGKRVGTLAASEAERMLKELGGVDIKLYSDMFALYRDTTLERIDAVFVDLPIAAYYASFEPGVRLVGDPVGEGYYAIGIKKGNTQLKSQVDAALGRLLENGELEKILRRWHLWNDKQRQLKDPPSAREALASTASSVWTHLPLLLKGTWVTIQLCTLAMMLAVLLGLSLTVSRLYGPKPLAWLSAAYVEIFRGTPLLIQLYLIYYGLPNLGIKLDPMTAAVLGLGLNYAAYEAENYRAAIKAVPAGQVEAALSLGLSQWQKLRHVILPQAFRVALPPVTNDFVALLKDSSIVSVITMVELTKTYGMLASTTYDYIGIGLVTAALYFAISYPVSLFAQWLERRLDQVARQAPPHPPGVVETGTA